MPTRVLRLLLLAVLACGLLSTTPDARAGSGTPSTNPFLGHRWGVYEGKQDQSWEPYLHATGHTRAVLGKIALRPKAKWFGGWVANKDIQDTVARYVANAQAGDPDTLVQLTLFRMAPWEHDACTRLPTRAEQASYRDWIDRAARGIGSAYAAVVLQPDGPFALCVPHGSTVPSQLIGYATRTLAALPHTSVYIDAGAADWPAAGQGGVDAAVSFLLPADVADARGIALNSTHYSATSLEVQRGAAIVQALAAHGIADKHVVVNTSSNGHPFEFGRYDGKDPDNARVCRSRTDRRLCVSLGIPPTADVTNARWGLSPGVAALAKQYVDAYLWIGRPWLNDQADPYVVKRALGLVASSPY